MPGNQKLELDEDVTFLKKEWLVQRIAWVLWVLIVVAALIGLVGPGPLSNAQATGAEGLLRIDYERFLHYHRPTMLAVTLGPSEQVGNPARLKLAQSLLDRAQVLRIEPEPERCELAADGIVYSFNHASDSGGKVIFHFEYQQPGNVQGSIALNQHRPITFQQFVYP